MEQEDCRDANRKVMDAIAADLGLEQLPEDIDPEVLRIWARSHCPCMNSCHKCRNPAEFSERELDKLHAATVWGDRANICVRPLCRRCKPFGGKILDFWYSRGQEVSSGERWLALILGLVTVILATAMVIAMKFAD